MFKFGKAVVKFHVPILIIGLLLLIPSVLGYLATGVNYDMLTYLPEDMETVQGQDILLNDFGKGAFSLIVTEGMDDASVAELTDKIKAVPHVATALSYADMAPSSIPDEAIPSDILENFKNGQYQMIAVFFDGSTSAETTLNAVTEIRNVANEHVFVSGLSAFVLDLKNVAEHEEPIYVGMAVLCALIILLLVTDSFLAPFIFLASIGMAILYNLGSNIVLGQIAYITKALAAVLQLAVTMDYSIFLWNSYTENRGKYPDDPKRAMAQAIGETLTSIFSSAMTATAGFLAMCFMSYTMGADLGIVMAKGCLFGLVASVTLLPSLILVFDKPLMKLSHKKIIPNVAGLARIVTGKRYWVFLLVFVILLVPACWGFFNKPVYYDFTNMLTGSDSSLTEEETPFHTADEKVHEAFGVSTTEMVLCDSHLNHGKAKEMLNRINDVEGVVYAVGYDSFIGGMVPDAMVPDALNEALKNGDYQLVLINSAYKVSTADVNEQVDAINEIIHEYDDSAMLIGEAPATKDLIELTDHDFMVVDAIAIVAVLLILLIVFRSLTLPFILVLVIEFAIFINIGLPYYTGDVMSFLTPICISTIQLGSTVNYAILMTTRYKRERAGGLEKRDAISVAFQRTFPAVVASGLSFFFGVFGVSLISRMGLITQLCGMMGRGALISTACVLFILPAMFMLLDSVIVKTSHGFRSKGALPQTANKEVQV